MKINSTRMLWPPSIPKIHTRCGESRKEWMRVSSTGETNTHVKEAGYELRSQHKDEGGTSMVRSVCFSVERTQKKGKVTLKQAWLTESANMVSLAFKAPAGFELAEGESLTNLPKWIWSWEMSQGWGLEIWTPPDGMRDGKGIKGGCKGETGSLSEMFEETLDVRTGGFEPEQEAGNPFSRGAAQGRHEVIHPLFFSLKSSDVGHGECRFQLRSSWAGVEHHCQRHVFKFKLPWNIIWERSWELLIGTFVL